MYVMQPTIRQYQAFQLPVVKWHSTDVTWHLGQKGLSVAFDLATYRGYDSHYEKVVVMSEAGVAIHSILDMKILLISILFG